MRCFLRSASSVQHSGAYARKVGAATVAPFHGGCGVFWDGMVRPVTASLGEAVIVGYGRVRLVWVRRFRCGGVRFGTVRLAQLRRSRVVRRGRESLGQERRGGLGWFGSGTVR